MRTLKFIVEGQNLKQDPNCDFSGLFPGKNPHILAEFTLPPEWKTGLKVVAFHSILGKEYPPKPLNEDGTCEIPVEALDMPVFRIQLLRKYRTTTTMTNELTVYQKGGKA